MNTDHIDPEALRTACLVNAGLAGLFSVWSFAIALLVIVSPYARPERLAYGMVTAAAAIALWLVWWFLRRVYRLPTTPVRGGPRSGRR